MRFDEFMELALYHPTAGFFAIGRGAGRAGGDFITSPEVGPLFGSVVASYLDNCWDEQGQPEHFTVAEFGAGRGALAIAINASRPRCLAALDYSLIEISAGLRAKQADHLPIGVNFQSLAPADTPSASVVVANELLDNLPFGLMEYRDNAWHEVMVIANDSGADEGEFGEVLEPASEAVSRELSALVVNPTEGARVPWQQVAADWVEDRLVDSTTRRLLAVDYCATTAELSTRGQADWLRTYRGQERGGEPLERPGSQDITGDVCVDQLPNPTRVATQAEWLARFGIGDLVEAASERWEERAHVGDLEAIRARSVGVEAQVLQDAGGLGGFKVLEWTVPMEQSPKGHAR